MVLHNILLATPACVETVDPAEDCETGVIPRSRAHHKPFIILRTNRDVHLPERNSRFIVTDENEPHSAMAWNILG